MVYTDPSGLMSDLEWVVRGALRNGRSFVYWNGFYMNFGFTGWGDSPNFGDIYKGLFNGSTVINITANYVSYGTGSSTIGDARSALGSVPSNLIEGTTCRVTGFSVNVVKVEGAVQSNGGDINILGDLNNSVLVGSAVNQPAYFRSSQIVKKGRFAVNGWKTYSNAFKGSQHVSSTSVKEAKIAFRSLAKTTSRISTGLTVVSFGITYTNHAAGNVSDGRYYVEQTINVIGLFGPWGAGISIGLGAVDAVWGDEIETWIRE